MPHDALVAQAAAELIEEGQEGQFDGPQAGPKQGDDGELQLHIPGRLGQDIGRGGLQTTSHARDHIHDGHGEVIEDGADGQEGQGGQDQGVVDEEAAEVGVADEVADAGEEAGDGQAGPDGPLL